MEMEKIMRRNGSIGVAWNENGVAWN